MTPTDPAADREQVAREYATGNQCDDEYTPSSHSSLYSSFLAGAEWQAATHAAELAAMLAENERLRKEAAHTIRLAQDIEAKWPAVQADLAALRTTAAELVTLVTTLSEDKFFRDNFRATTQWLGSFLARPAVAALLGREGSK